MATHEVVTDDGVVLAVEFRGPADAPTVVLVHGFPDSSRVWDEVVERLARTFRVVTYDVRGAGRSTAPPRRSGYRLEQLADDLVAVADAVSPYAPVHVVGHDWGAIQAFEAATSPAHAARLASFTCVSGASFDHAGRALRRAWRDGVWSGLRRTVGQMATSWYILWFQLPVVPEAILRSPLGPRLVDRLEPVPPRPGHPAATFPRDAANGVNLYRANLDRVRATPPGRGARAGPGPRRRPTTPSCPPASSTSSATSPTAGRGCASSTAATGSRGPTPTPWRRPPRPGRARRGGGGAPGLRAAAALR